MSGRATAQVTTLTTRGGKAPVDAVCLLADWQARADALGFDAVAGDALLHRRLGAPERAGRQWVSALLLGKRGLTATRSTFTRTDVLQQLAGALPAGAPVGELEAWADELLAAAAVVRVDGAPLGPARPGRSPPLAGTTTGEMLAVEAGLLGAAHAAMHAGVADAGPAGWLRRASPQRGCPASSRRWSSGC